MRLVSLMTQKRLVIIPYVNITIIFIWLYNSSQLSIPFKGVPQTFLIVGVSALPLILIQMIVSAFCTVAGEILGYVSIYLIPLFVGIGLISYQDKLLRTKDRS